MRHGTDEWRRFGYRLDSFESALNGLQYHSAFVPLTEPQGSYTVGFFAMRAGASHAVPATGIQSILSESNLGAPHGADLLKPAVLPEFPQCRKPRGA
jgi:hypothetical protein